MKIGLCGFGVVGRGVYEITQTRDDMQVTKVLCLEDIQLPDAEAVQKLQRDPGILRGHEVRLSQGLLGPGREVPQVADGRGDQIERAAHGSSSCCLK